MTDEVNETATAAESRLNNSKMTTALIYGLSYDLAVSLTFVGLALKVDQWEKKYFKEIISNRTPPVMVYP